MSPVGRAERKPTRGAASGSAGARRRRRTRLPALRSRHRLRGQGLVRSGTGQQANAIARGWLIRTRAGRQLQAPLSQRTTPAARRQRHGGRVRWWSRATGYGDGCCSRSRSRRSVSHLRRGPCEAPTRGQRGSRGDRSSPAAATPRTRPCARAWPPKSTALRRSRGPTKRCRPPIARTFPRASTHSTLIATPVRVFR
jgi:hypothetical protein